MCACYSSLSFVFNGYFLLSACFSRRKSRVNRFRRTRDVCVCTTCRRPVFAYFVQ